MFPEVVTMSRPPEKRPQIHRPDRLGLQPAREGWGELSRFVAFDAVGADPHGVGPDSEAVKTAPEPVKCGARGAEGAI